MALLKKRASAVDVGWVPYEGGYEHTRSPEIIANSLTWLKKDRVFLILVFKGYQSGNTILVKIKDKILHIDKPRDWPGKIKKVRVIFRNSSKLWTHFICNIKAVSFDTLFLHYPEEMFMLQRRTHYRVDVPRGSYASFHCQGEVRRMSIKDISANGMLIYTQSRLDILQRGQTVSKIQLHIVVEEDDPDTQNGVMVIKIQEGEVVRSFSKKDRKLFFFGIHFIPEPTEEERILKYIRQRELAILRKGVTGKD